MSIALSALYVSVPLAILLFAPHDALARRLWRVEGAIRWHKETMVVMTLVAAVVVISGGESIEWCGWAALVLAHGRNSVLARLTEAQIGTDHRVECHVWAQRYLLMAEFYWALYFIQHRSWAALCGVGVFVGYAQWRRWLVKGASS